jgi:hypothetical protein
LISWGPGSVSSAESEFDSDEESEVEPDCEDLFGAHHGARLCVSASVPGSSQNAPHTIANVIATATTNINTTHFFLPCFLLMTRLGFLITFSIFIVKMLFSALL